MSAPVRFHASLNVSDLARSVSFFRTLLGVEPAKVRADYAKFEPDSPPLVLSLEPASGVQGGGALNHAGFRLPDAGALVGMQERLERAGIRTKREDGVECCYARQTKFWVHDPDGTLWEVYTFDGDLDHRGAGQSAEVVLGAGLAPRERVVWEHRMNAPVPARIPLGDATADEVLLRGTFNLPLSAEEQRSTVAEAARVLKPGGRVFVHVLSGETGVQNPELPGPAGAVRAVPAEGEAVALLEAAGFVGVKLLKYDPKPCFVRNGVGMRETQLEGFAPPAPTAAQAEVLYKGPFREVHDDLGNVYPRGRRVTVCSSAVERLRAGELLAQFTVFEPNTARPVTATACGT
ncbi:MAG TPA: ArsI/CadI family heavy metal resistance metalloenzyme [Gemmata sp.]